jgi:hypothetical protein
MTAVNKLIDRMFNFDLNGKFDSYPGLSCKDDNLIFAALKESESDDAVRFMCFVASENATTRAQYENAKRYIGAYVEACWDCNMSEAPNELHRAA